MILVKRIKTRALSVLLLAAVAVIGLSLYVARFAVNGDRWASSFVNQSVYHRGSLSVGTLVDRNGVILYGATDGHRTFAEDAATRRATLHVVGDANGFIGTGALTMLAPQLIGYNAITGTYSRTGEGSTVALTIDSRLNVEAHRALDGRRGAVMVMNYQTGEILCMVSGPTFDANNPPGDIEDDPKFEGVYINRAISAVYPPGSTFKLITAAAAIESIHDISDRTFHCDGSMWTGDGAVNCPSSHGTMSFKDALAESCNGVFAELSLELGSDTLARYAKKYGLSERTTVGRVRTAEGNFGRADPDTTALAWSGIGQHTNTVCPAAMLRFVGAIANDGITMPMRLTQRTGFSLFAQGSRIMKRETAERLGEMMNYNARNSSFPGLTMHAKSGTAQVGGDAKPHAWFAGYISNEGCPLAFVVVVENGGGGAAVAGAVASRVLQAAKTLIEPMES